MAQVKEVLKDIFTLNRPVGRLTYFLYALCTHIFYLFFLWLASGFGTSLMKENVNLILALLILIIGVVLFVALLWVMFLFATKRIWDILGKKGWAIAFVIVYLIFAVVAEVLKINDSVIPFIMSIILLFTPGQLAKSKKVQM